MNDLILISLVMLAEALLHYIPWPQFLKGHDLPRPAAYVLGVLGLAIPYTVWLWEQGEHVAVWHLWMVIVAGGIAVLAAYGADAIRDLYWREREATEREEARRA